MIKSKAQTADLYFLIAVSLKLIGSRRICLCAQTKYKELPEGSSLVSYFYAVVCFKDFQG